MSIAALDYTLVVNCNFSTWLQCEAVLTSICLLSREVCPLEWNIPSSSEVKSSVVISSRTSEAKCLKLIPAVFCFVVILLKLLLNADFLKISSLLIRAKFFPPDWLSCAQFHCYTRDNSLILLGSMDYVCIPLFHLTGAQFG